MKTRKLILLASIALLSLILVLQLVFSGGSRIRTLTLKEEPTAVLIEKNASDVIKVAKIDKDTFILNDSIDADAGFANTMFSEIASVKIIDTVANSVSDEGELQRYGLDPVSVLTVTAQKGSQTVRTLRIGKAATSGAQTYAQIDNSTDVVLVSGYLRSYYEKTTEDLTKKEEVPEESSAASLDEEVSLDVDSAAE